MNEDVKTWLHSRKGIIRGVVEKADGSWLHIRLVGDHDLRWASSDHQTTRDGETIVVREQFLEEVE